MQPRELAHAQRTLWRLITAPEGVEHALAEAGDPEGRELAELVRGDKGVSPVARVGVYSNAYFARIRDALAEDYGALAGTLGEAAFHDLVKLYLIAHPPARPSLRFAGAKLPGFLARSRATELFRERWPFAPELAALEWALVEAFDAPDAPALARDALARVAPERWGSLRFEAVPALALLSLDWPVQRLREHFDADRGTPAELAPEPVRVQVWRRDERVHYRALEVLEADALALLRAGGSVGDLCLRLAQEIGEDATAGRAVAWLEGWIAEGLFSALRVE